MRTSVCGLNFTLTEAIRRHVETRVATAVGAARDGARDATVRLRDTNGDKGGVDKACRIVARVRKAGAVIVEAVDRDLYVAVNRAAAKLHAAVLRRLDRSRPRRRGRAEGRERRKRELKGAIE